VTATLSAVLGPRRPSAMISQATLPEQQVVTGTLGEIAGLAARAGLASPATLVVGEVAGWASPSGACAPPSPPCGEEMVGLGSFG
jgi:siroheme synthase